MKGKYKQLVFSVFIIGIAVMLKIWQNTLVQCLGLIGVIGAGIYFGVAIALQRGKKYHVPEKKNLASIANAILKHMVEIRQNFHHCEKKVVISRSMDVAIDEILDLIVRDYIMTWYSELSKDKEQFPHIVKDELWGIIEKVSERLQNVDMLHFMTNDISSTWHKHFYDVRIANTKPEVGQEQPKFMMHPWLETEETETEFLRTVADVLLIHLLPKEYSHVQSVRHLLREILACSVLKPAIGRLCEADFVNETLYRWLCYREHLALDHARTYTHAATYEQFMELIEKSDDLEHLKQLRYNIITEIVQASAIQHFKRTKGEDVEKESAPRDTTKGSLLRARNLGRYINQLRVCRKYCEKRIHLLGGPDYKAYISEADASQDHVPGSKVLSYAVIMETEEARNYFYKYLCRIKQDALLQFWAAVENMRRMHRKYWHTQAMEIYELYLSHQQSALLALLDKALVRGMESYMKGDQGPDAFFAAQDVVLRYLEEEHYPSFIVSDLYRRYMHSCHSDFPASTDGQGAEVAREAGVAEEEGSLTSSGSSTGGLSVAASDDSERIDEHSSYAHAKLRTLHEKCLNKTQALQALKCSHKNDPRRHKLQTDMELEIAELQKQRRQLEFHVERTDLWVKRVGRWRANIYNCETVVEAGRKLRYFVIVVHLPGAASTEAIGGEGGAIGGGGSATAGGGGGRTHGWVVSRTHKDFQALERQLIQLKPTLRLSEYALSALRGRAPDGSKLSVRQLQQGLCDFLTTVLRDDHLPHSEAVFIFFSPSPEHLKAPGDTSAAAAAKKRSKRFTFTKLFTSSAGGKADSSDSDEDLLFADLDSAKFSNSSKAKDSTASTLYKLVGEVFEVKGVFKWFRKTFIIFVKVTFGSSVNRQLRSLVDWVFSEPMLVYYLHLFRDSYWPDGQLGAPPPPRTDQQKLQTRFLAKEKVIKSIPDVLKNLVGEQNARRGAIKTFEVLQEHKLNKHLFYNIILLVLYELFPEINDSYAES